ncbi:roadblock/LC7 domain-containing protein [Streptosporangium sp. 'caverna']|jgi:predicted regulator of Ras-like GTPase activity (Roadblock/LC7/MglB family)|uniref:roadblock/LC7 domain-containing protein n=1 Tax=Streptosporangium TaxID=2000 RepID=UPI000D7D503C|nr:roadblock/LC7 domain-containing protein [Streptosporangium sp. 'caverna']AWS47992.1 dynein regulation protein LC7 [Streptosporangium sp. 'caverna']WSA16939.1 roadblock/LC7 domain-containing protein [Streptosporangium subroseum]
MTGKLTNTGELNWLLDDLTSRVGAVRQAVILSTDGLAVGFSKGLSREDAEHLSAVAAGFQSLARGAGRHFGGGEVRQTIVEMESAFLFVTAAGRGTCLAVLSSSEADVGHIAYEMAMLVKRVGQHISTHPRQGLS